MCVPCVYGVWYVVCVSTCYIWCGVCTTCGVCCVCCHMCVVCHVLCVVCCVLCCMMPRVLCRVLCVICHVLCMACHVACAVHVVRVVCTVCCVCCACRVCAVCRVCCGGVGGVTRPGRGESLPSPLTRLVAVSALVKPSGGSSPGARPPSLVCPTWHWGCGAGWEATRRRVWCLASPGQPGSSGTARPWAPALPPTHLCSLQHSPRVWAPLLRETPGLHWGPRCPSEAAPWARDEALGHHVNT